MSPQYFHGGIPGLRPGELIVPPSSDDQRHLVEGCDVCDARRTGDPSDYDVNHRFDRTYVTTDRFVARCFAAGYPLGDVYQVEPLGPLEADPEHEQSFAVESARVRVVMETRTVIGPRLLRRWLRLADGERV